MNILFVAPYLPSLIRVRPYHFIRELARHHDVSLLVTESRPSPEAVQDLRSICTDVDVVPVRLSRGLISCAKASLAGEPLQSAICHSPALEQRLDSLVKHGPFDVVHVEHLRAARLVRHLPDSLPRVFDAVDSISLLLERTIASSHSPLQRAIARLELGRTRTFEGRILAHFDRIVATAVEDAAALGALNPRVRTEVIPNGVDLDYFHPLEGPREPETIVFSGKMSYHANVTAALSFARSVFPRVRAHRPGARLTIVGSKPPRSILELARDPAISVTGYVPDVRPYIGGAQVAVCPMVVKVGIQNKLLEAMAMETPVVATPQGASGLGAQGGRDLLLAETPGELAAAVCHLLDDSERARRLGAAGRRYVEAAHRWPVAARRLEGLYQEAITERRAAPRVMDPAWRARSLDRSALVGPLN